ncbi:TPA: adenylate/guanylate cyclase domain-containing protein [Providencia rettgeri]
MKIEDLYSNLNEDMSSISKRKKTNSPHFGKMEFNPKLKDELAKLSGMESNNVSLPSFESYISESANKNAAERDLITPISDRRSIFKLRSLFGKDEETHSLKIGCHPDFLHLDEPNSSPESGYVVTMFIDIIGSTKLGVLYSPNDVFLFKNSVITGAIETITAFDGHVHRIMGDAVMAFFRNKDLEGSCQILNSAIDAINCASYLIEVMNKIVAPQIRADGLEKVGIRIGIDLGMKDWVLWSNYGTPGINEVTATSFYVDIASKLQHKAPTNSIMIGENLAKELGLIGSDFIKIKKKKKDGEEVNDKYVIDVSSNGYRLKYRQYLLDNDKYFSCLPHGMNESKINLNVKYGPSKDITNLNEYMNCSKIIPKDNHVNFAVEYTDPAINHTDVVEFKFEVINTGEDAKEQNKEKNDFGNHESKVKANRKGNDFTAEHWEEAKYKGLHHMFISFLVNGKQIGEKIKFNLFIA